MTDPTNTDLEARRTMLKERIDNLTHKIRVQKVVVTRSIKTRDGDFFVGFNAMWDSVQDDSQQGLDTVMDDEPTNAMTLKEAKDVAILLGHYAEMCAVDNAVLNGAMDIDRARLHVRECRKAMAQKLLEGDR